MGRTRPSRLSRDIRDFRRNISAKQAVGGFFALLGVVLTIVSAVVTGPNQLLTAVIAVFAQIAAAYLFAAEGRVHPSHAKRAFSRLLGLAERARQAERRAQDDFESNDKSAEDRQTQMGLLSVELSWIGDGLYSAAADWIAFNEPLNEMISEDQRKAMSQAAEEARIAEGDSEVAKGAEV